MKKVFQTIVDPDRGNCMQAVIASLLELPLGDIPNFLEMEKNNPDTNAHWEMWQFLESKGYGYCVINPKDIDKDYKFTIKCLKHDGGINGYFYAGVPSQTFEGRQHAVIIDANMNIVHDPNPNGKALGLSKHDIIDITTNNDNWHIDVKGKLVIVPPKMVKVLVAHNSIPAGSAIHVYKELIHDYKGIWSSMYGSYSVKAKKKYCKIIER